MTTAILVIVAAEAVLLLLLFGATVELHRQVLQLRQYSGLVDDARALTYNSEVVATDLPIPALRRLRDDDRAAVLVVSDGCTTCFEIIQHVAASHPRNLMVLVESHSEADAGNWLARYGLVTGDEIVYDQGGLISGRLGISITPAVVKFEGISPVAASTIPSTRQFDKVAEWLGESETALERVDGVTP